MRSVALSKILKADEVNSHLQTRRCPTSPFTSPAPLTPAWENPDEAPPNLLPAPTDLCSLGREGELEFAAW